MTTPNQPPSLHFLEDRWDEAVASKLDAPDLLRYRSNLLGSDLRLTNFGGGNTSSKIDEVDPLDGQTKKVLWVKGSGGDLGSIKRAGFATLYLDKVLALTNSYKGVPARTRSWACTRCAPSATTPWLLRSIRRCMASCLSRMSTICILTGALRSLLPPTARRRWRSSTSSSATRWCGCRGSARALSLHDAARCGRAVPGCDGVVLGGHGLFTWGETQRESYLNTITIIDQLGQFTLAHAAKKGISVRRCRSTRTHAGP
jgi:hypothetical protein